MIKLLFHIKFGISKLKVYSIFKWYFIFGIGQFKFFTDKKKLYIYLNNKRLIYRINKEYLIARLIGEPYNPKKTLPSLLDLI